MASPDLAKIGQNSRGRNQILEQTSPPREAFGFSRGSSASRHYNMLNITNTHTPLGKNGHARRQTPDDSHALIKTGMDLPRLEGFGFSLGNIMGENLRKISISFDSHFSKNFFFVFSFCRIQKLFSHFVEFILF